LYIYLIICPVFSGCVTQEACLKKFPIREVHDTLVVYRDTIIQVPVLGTDTVYKEATIHDTLIVHSGTAHGQSWVIHDTLKLFVWQSDTVLTLKFDSLIKVVTLKDVEIHTIQQECKKTKWDRYLNKLVAIVFGFVFIAILVFARKLFT
jgi:hypothetical protein